MTSSICARTYRSQPDTWKIASVVTGRMRCSSRSPSESAPTTERIPLEGQRRQTPFRRLDGKDEDQDQPDPEGRQGGTERHREIDDLVEHRVAVQRGENPGRDRDQQRDHQRAAGQQQRVRQPREDFVTHRPAVIQRKPEVAAHELTQPAQVLLVKRSVQPERALDPVEITLRDPRNRDAQVIDRAAGHEMHEREGQQRRSQEEKRDLEEAARDVPRHGKPFGLGGELRPPNPPPPSPWRRGKGVGG